MQPRDPKQIACEAALLLTDVIRDLTIPQHLNICATELEKVKAASTTYASAVRRIAAIATVIGLYRMRETRNHFLTPWLFSEDDLRSLELPKIEDFVRDWGAFEIIRSQWAAHAQTKTNHNSPGRLVQPEILGQALERTGLGDEDVFFARVREELVPAIERVRGRLLDLHPSARVFLTTEYPARLQQGALDEERRRSAV